MSFTRNPKRYDINRNVNSYGYKDVERFYSQAKNIIESTDGNYNDLQLEMLQTCIDNMEFIIEHPKFKANSKTRQFYKLIDWSYNVLNPIKGIDAESLQKYTL